MNVDQTSLHVASGLGCGVRRENFNLAYPQSSIYLILEQNKLYPMYNFGREKPQIWTSEENKYLPHLMTAIKLVVFPIFFLRFYIVLGQN